MEMFYICRSNSGLAGRPPTCTLSVIQAQLHSYPQTAGYLLNHPQSYF